MLRTILFYARYLPLTAALTLLAICVPSAAKWCARTWGRAAIHCTGITLDVRLGDLDPNQTYIFMANHQSQLDIPALTTALAPWQIGFVAKKGLFNIPLFGKAMINAGNIPIDRGNRRSAMKSVDKAAERVRAGQSIVIFPEGTRATDLSCLQEFKIGGMIIALKTGLPVVPVTISGSGEALPKHNLCFGPQRTITIRALPPISTQGRYTLKEREIFKEDLYRAMSAAYTEQLNG
ncbi:1-acyl-sn-glycerol-3-phosphate acyltransferase [Desulfobaculum xiamenense]|uniref:1-acyl-sn-glycerol-3-phosphate acyltransferase n=1 Tax=Desulfobaculum xiamenense TaxID=995050 RepID=A0A846QHT9_9BACT|nr:lysophospholipid acyltransferase family protein [Desulfobaculum xiamenense]NJB67828.1 1-acyl-sn-glycerol-3-phosphate acyltransferase [Desulfobaculum xiamenense]